MAHDGAKIKNLKMADENKSSGGENSKKIIFYFLNNVLQLVYQNFIIAKLRSRQMRENNYQTSNFGIFSSSKHKENVFYFLYSIFFCFVD